MSMGFVTAVLGIWPKGYRKVRILEKSGRIIEGRAIRAFNGYHIWESDGILDAFGKDGGFPNGNHWDWEKWEFTDE